MTRDLRNPEFMQPAPGNRSRGLLQPPELTGQGGGREGRQGRGKCSSGRDPGLLHKRVIRGMRTAGRREAKCIFEIRWQSQVLVNGHRSPVETTPPQPPASHEPRSPRHIWWTSRGSQDLLATLHQQLLNGPSALRGVGDGSTWPRLSFPSVQESKVTQGLENRGGWFGVRLSNPASSPCNIFLKDHLLLPPP